mmetsp:Transcript_7769/g.28650  ORF Transcript_7769/g.28650 Transcript_7769/m.28650 type:complete len:260 (+) Transcript_7769:2275-3054(+)
MPCLRLLHSIPCEYICSTRGFQSQFLYRAKHPLFGVETLCSLLNEMYAWVILPLGIIQEPLRERFDVNDVAYYLVDCIKLPFVIEWHYVSVGRRGRHHPHMAIVHGEPSLVVERVDHIWNIPPDDQDVHVALEVTVDESIHCWLPHPRLPVRIRLYVCVSWSTSQQSVSISTSRVPAGNHAVLRTSDVACNLLCLAPILPDVHRPYLAISIQHATYLSELLQHRAHKEGTPMQGLCLTYIEGPMVPTRLMEPGDIDRAP